MTDNILYHLVQPDNVKSNGYKENENLDFSLAFEGRKYVAGSLRLEGDLQVFSTGGGAPTPVAPGNDVKIACSIGAHSVCAGWVTSFQNAGVVENLQSYPRLVAMKAAGIYSKNDYNNSDMVAEMRSSSDKISRKSILPRVIKQYGGGGAGLVAGGSATTQLTAAMKTDPSFSIKPMIALNNLVGPNQMVSFAQSGMIKLTVTLEKNLGVLFGGDVSADYNYTLQNVRITFRSVPDDGPQPVVMRTSLALKNSMTSAANNISSKVPAVCDAVSISYLPQSHEYNAAYNNVALEEPPLFHSITYSFNDALNRFVTYKIDSKVEMGRRALDSLDSDGSHKMTLERISTNDGFLNGLSWEALIDLSNQKFNINSITGVSSNEPYIQFSFFHSLRKL
jgi:hypothetical protein